MKHPLPIALLAFLLAASGFFSGSAHAQAPQRAAAAALYVNDVLTIGDVYTTRPGSDVLGDGSAGAPFATVGAALVHADAATTTIFIDAGTYSERVVLNKNISLQGVDTARTVFDGGLLPSSTQTFETGILVTAAGGTPGSPVTISNLKVQRYDFGIQNGTEGNHANFLFQDIATTQNRQFGIYWNGLAFTENLTFRRVRATKTALSPNTTTNGAGRGLLLINGDKRNIVIEDGIFMQNRRAGIDINDGSVSGLVIRNNQLGFNLGPALAVLGAGGQRDAGNTYLTAAALIENNFVRNNASNGFELKSCTGNGQTSGPGSFVVRNNYIVRTIGAPTNLADDNAGIAFVDRDRNVIATSNGVTGDLTTGGAVIQNNIIRGYLADATRTFFKINGFGIVVEGLNNTLTGNVVAQCQYGVQVQDRPANSSGSTEFFDVDRNAALVATGISIHSNLLDSCTAAIRAVNLTNTVDASANWLGSNTAADVRGSNGLTGLVVTLGGPSSFTRASSFAPTGRIDYSPFLHNRADAEVSVGFQSDLSYLHVDQFSPSVGGTGRLQEGLALVTEGGTISTAAATYDETATFTKNLTLTNDGTTTLQGVTLNGAGKVVALAAPFSLSGTLTLTQGLLQTSAANLLTVTAGATTTEGTATAYVEGPLRKLGNSAFVFPLGKGGIWARVAISAPADPASAFTAEYFTGAYPNQAVASPLNNVSRVEYWSLDRAGSASEVSVRLYFENAVRSGINDFSADLQVARFTGSTWVTEGNGGLSGSLASGSVFSAGPVATFGEPFTFGSLSSVVNPLPVELVSFRATLRQAGLVALDWKTASEKNNRGFSVERSFDAHTWQPLGFVAGQGTTTTAHTYTYQDQPIQANTVVYYRLAQQDTDGRITYAPTAAVLLPAREAAGAKLSFYPNPATEQITFTLSEAPSAPLTATITDLTGRVVLTRTLAPSLTPQLLLPASLPAGSYLVQLSGAGTAPQASLLVKP